MILKYCYKLSPAETPMPKYKRKNMQTIVKDKYMANTIRHKLSAMHFKSFSMTQFSTGAIILFPFFQNVQLHTQKETRQKLSICHVLHKKAALHLPPDMTITLFMNYLLIQMSFSFHQQT